MSQQPGGGRAWHRGGKFNDGMWDETRPVRRYRRTSWRHIKERWAPPAETVEEWHRALSEQRSPSSELMGDPPLCRSALGKRAGELLCDSLGPFVTKFGYAHRSRRLYQITLAKTVSGELK